jgi:predicted nucleic acid-binding protein
VSYLLDTDCIINVLRGIPRDSHEVERLRSAGLAVSIVSFGELFEGVAASPNPASELALIDAFLESFPVVQLDTAILMQFGEIRHGLRRQGQLIPDLDLLIATTAISNELILMTHNLRHFARIPDLRVHRPGAGS